MIFNAEHHSTYSRNLLLIWHSIKNALIRTIEFPVVAFTSSIFFLVMALPVLYTRKNFTGCVHNWVFDWLRLRACQSFAVWQPKEGFPFLFFFARPVLRCKPLFHEFFARAAHIFLVALEQYANGAFMSVKIVARNVKLYSCLLWLRCLL